METRLNSYSGEATTKLSHGYTLVIHGYLINKAFKSYYFFKFMEKPIFACVVLTHFFISV